MKRFVAISSRGGVVRLIIAFAVTAVAMGAENAAAGPGLPRAFDITLTKPAPTALTNGPNELELVVKAPSGKPMAGKWKAIVTVKQDGKELARKMTTLRVG